MLWKDESAEQITNPQREVTETIHTRFLFYKMVSFKADL
jgi:hypothetical protein